MRPGLVASTFIAGLIVIGISLVRALVRRLGCGYITMNRLQSVDGGKPGSGRTLDDLGPRGFLGHNGAGCPHPAGARGGSGVRLGVS